MARNLSKDGLDLIKSFEGLSLKAYKCVSTEKYYTIGYGHYGADVKAGQTITKKQAEELLKQDVERFVRHVNSYMPRYNFNQNQFDALVSFAYNIGNINQLTASGTRSISQISASIPLYNKSGGRVLNGLVKRRAKERALFNKPTNEVPISPHKTNNDIAREVIQGKWGNNPERKERLTKAGYDYKTIQAIVNKMLKG